MSPANGLLFLLLLDVGAAADELLSLLPLLFLLVLLLQRSCLFPASLLPRVPSARRPLCRCAFSRMAVTKVSFNWCQRWKKHPAHPARSKFVSRSNLCGGEENFALVLVDKAAE